MLLGKFCFGAIRPLKYTMSSLHDEAAADLLIGVYEECSAPGLAKDSVAANFRATCACACACCRNVLFCAMCFPANPLLRQMRTSSGASKSRASPGKISSPSRSSGGARLARQVATYFKCHASFSSHYYLIIIGIALRYISCAARRTPRSTPSRCSTSGTCSSARRYGDRQCLAIDYLNRF